MKRLTSASSSWSITVLRWGFESLAATLRRAAQRFEIFLNDASNEGVEINSEIWLTQLAGLRDTDCGLLSMDGHVPSSPGRTGVPAAQKSQDSPGPRMSPQRIGFLNHLPEVCGKAFKDIWRFLNLDLFRR